MTTENILAQQYDRQLCVSITGGSAQKRQILHVVEFLMQHFRSLEYVTVESREFVVSLLSLLKPNQLLCISLGD